MRELEWLLFLEVEDGEDCEQQSVFTDTHYHDGRGGPHAPMPYFSAG